MTTQNLNTKDLFNLLKQNFEYFSYVNKIDIYKNVTFIEIKTDLLFFALELAENGNIELVFRNNETLKIFTEFFHYPFEKGTMLYVGDLCVNHLFHTTNHYKTDAYHILLARTREILDKCLSIGKEPYLYLNISVDILKKINEATQLQLKNNLYFDMDNFMRGKLLSITETLHKIKDKELSIARFGDGKINCMITENGCSFQKHHWGLLQELRDINLQEDDLLLCYPSLLVENNWWQSYWGKNWARCKFFLQRNIYGDSFITRPQGFHMYGQHLTKLWKEIWWNKRVCFITGEGSRLNANHIIFDNIKDVDYIYSKPNNAYDDIDNIVEKCRQKQNVDMFLIALGPTGTVLASRLFKLGYRALDIGHLNNSYDNVFSNALRPECQ